MATRYDITLEDAKALLAPRMPALANALRIAVHEWSDGLGKYHAKVNEDLRALFINQLWHYHSIELLREDAGISRQKNGRHEYLRVDGSLVLRIKHVGPTYRSWNYPTRRSQAWNAQAHFLDLPPMPRLNFGYRLDITGTVVKDAMVMLSQEGHSIWRWQVWGYPVSEFPATHRDMLGRVVYAHDDYSEATMP